ncbi:MAG: hypothetical protein HY537_08035 [Deltaproteobacteria bacterium]|nr:hypothetical protein [Deltaproteobacteria bacterium]
MRAMEVSRCLDKKLTMFGFEVADILGIFLCLSVLNFLFGQSSLKFFFAWLPSIVLALILRYGKKGKPDKFLIHWFRYQIKPGILSAFSEPGEVVFPPRLKGERR